MRPDGILGEGEHLRLVRRDGWEYVEHLVGRNSVAALATTSAGEIVLVEQRRAPVDTAVLELPAGIVDPEESLEEAVVRELHEETGFTVAEAPVHLFSSPILAGVTSSILHVFRLHCGPRTGAGGGTDRGGHGDSRLRSRRLASAGSAPPRTRSRALGCPSPPPREVEAARILSVLDVPPDGLLELRGVLGREIRRTSTHRV